VKAVLWVGMGGFVGAISRYLLATWVAGRAGTAFPLGTLVINLSGSFVLGLLLGGLENHTATPTLRLALATGVIGAYTTFSTFTYETIRLIEDGSALLAATNVGGSLVFGLGATFGGLVLGRTL